MSGCGPKLPSLAIPNSEFNRSIFQSAFPAGAVDGGSLPLDFTRERAERIDINRILDDGRPKDFCESRRDCDGLGVPGRHDHAGVKASKWLLQQTLSQFKLRLSRLT
jgi:hypothetical protein